MKIMKNDACWVLGIQDSKSVQNMLSSSHAYNKKNMQRDHLNGVKQVLSAMKGIEQ